MNTETPIFENYQNQLEQISDLREKLEVILQTIRMNQACIKAKESDLFDEIRRSDRSGENATSMEREYLDVIDLRLKAEDIAFRVSAAINYLHE